MKLHKILFTLSLIAAVTFGCEKEVIRPDVDSPEIQAGNEGIQRPINACGTSSFVNFVDGSNNIIGSIEVLNTETQVYFLVDMANGWMLQGFKVFAGNSIDLPKTGNGLIQMEEFPHQFAFNRAQDKSTFRIPSASLAACFDVAVYGMAVQLTPFGNVTTTRTVWANGTTVLNGKVFNYCSAICNNAQGPAQVN